MMRRELGNFLVVGLLTVLIDFLTYQGLLALQLLDVSTAKGLGFLTGTLFAYVANKVWTFGHQTHAAGSMYRFVVLYAATLVVNVLINGCVLVLLHQVSYVVQWAFLTATAASAALNFIGMKWFVFKNHLTKESI